MNNVLQLKGTFEQKSSSSKPGSPNLPIGQCVEVSKLQDLLKNLVELEEYWQKQDLLPGALITVYYNKIAAKSNRLQNLLGDSKNKPNSFIVGAKFSLEQSPKHIITYYISLEILKNSIERLKIAIDILNQKYNGKICYDTIEKINKKQIRYEATQLSKTSFLQIIVDVFYIEKFDVENESLSLNSNSIITLYKTDVKTQKLLEKIGINILSNRIIDDTTVLLRPDELEILQKEAPFLISMAVSDLKEITKDDFSILDNNIFTIPPPKNEPTIGVIDTLFDENVYFSDWVEYTNMLDSNIPISYEDYNHGTAVTSIIVDGPSFNPELDDGCGRFRARHFAVASGKSFNSFTILRSIGEIIAKNKDIKVWNLSLGSKLDIHPNFISPEAAILDKIQSENDVIFVIAGTNLSSNETKIRYIGAPADSINSLVVNSVDRDNKPSAYSRKGPVLSFYIKPDISYYGGDTKNPMRVCTPNGEAFVKGTSFAAPWIARKLSYLIDILGFNREIAKALIIHSATSWNKKYDLTLIGHGIVPKDIKDIVYSADDEIRFVLQGVSEKYDTYNYNIPIPVVKEKHPFIAKATLCYFPVCSRNQGVDYTNTELDIKFGRIDNNGTIKPINKNYQTEEYYEHIWEEDARKNFRKWDNVKHISDILTGRNKELKAYNNPLWGLSLKTKERLEKKYGEGLKFGIVITLKEIKGVNRIEEFISNAQLRGWIVNKIDIDTRIDIYNIAEEEIELE